MSEGAGTSSASTSSAGSMLLHPVGAVTSAVRQLPGASVVKEVFDGVLDTVGVVSPRARRVAAYTGAGLLGVVGVVEWPVAAAGAAVVWLTQPRAKSADGAGAHAAAPKPAAGKARAGRTTTRPAAKAARTAKPSAGKPAARKPSKTRAKGSATARQTTGARRAASTPSTAGGRTS